MIDVREQILARLEVTLGAVEVGVKCYRNRTDVPETARPCIILIDGDEEASAQDLARHATFYRRVTAGPEIWILIGLTEGVGSALNALRAKILHALLHDTTLKALLLDDGVVYDGAHSALEEGRRIEGSMVLRISFTYLLRPSDLAP